jgi:hypothetical protein
MKPMKLFFIVFAAILAAGAILLAGIYAKARLDEWERAKWVYASQAATASAAAKVPPLFSSDTSKALLRHTAIDREREYVSILENKPFGVPLTAQEQQDLKFVKADIAKPTDETPATKADEAEKIVRDFEANTKKAVETLPTPPPQMIALTAPVPIQTESGTVTLPVGTKLQFVSQINTKVHVRYLNSDYTIPIDATDLNRKRH